MKKDIKITIVGGGIGGLTTALCLEHFGFTNYTVYERASEFKEVGAAISLWPNALRVYKEIGIYNDLKFQWGELETMLLKTNKGVVLSKTTPNYDFPAVCIHRAHLLKVLYNNLDKNKLNTDFELVKIAYFDKPIAMFKNGKQIESDVIIGADGINSTVRKCLFDDGNPVDRGYTIWRGITELNTEGVSFGSETWGDGARIGLVPIKNNLYGWWATINSDFLTNYTNMRDKDILNTHFGDWHHPIPKIFDKSNKILKGKIGDRKPLKNWYQNSSVLIGDAAHPTTPNLGQGACMAIEGAYKLAYSLNQENNYEEAFSKYEKLHLKRAYGVVKQSLIFGKVGQANGKLLTIIRNSIMTIIPSSLTVKSLDKYFNYDIKQIK